MIVHDSWVLVVVVVVGVGVVVGWGVGVVVGWGEGPAQNACSGMERK